MTPINEALSQINADIEALANKQNDAALFEKYQYLVARLSLENFRNVLQSLLPVEQQMMDKHGEFCYEHGYDDGNEGMSKDYENFKRLFIE